MINDNELDLLYQQFLNGKCTAEELQELLSHFVEQGSNSTLVPMIQAELKGEGYSPDLEQRIDKIVAEVDMELLGYVHGKIRHIGEEKDNQVRIEEIRIEEIDSGNIENDELSLVGKQQVRRFPLYRKIAAAAILIMLSVGSWYTYQAQKKNAIPVLSTINDVQPGGNRAILTLADGNTINLSDDQTGIIIGSDSISYTDGSTLGSLSTFVIQRNEGSLPTQQANTPIQTLALSTPNGGQYQVTLPDGTKVWLNAATILKYPSRFDGKDRRVELEGEAYFEVSQVSGNRHEVSGKKSNAKLPFIVTSNGQEVTVLGTHFNIKSYNDEETKTTLLEGSVQVSTLSKTLSSRGTKDPYKPSNTPNIPTILNPGQQSILKGEKLTTQTINPTSSISWKNGLFTFKNADIQTLMREAARWYDIEVVYEGKIPEDHFTGNLPRSVTLSQFIKVLGWSDLKARLEGNRLIISQ